jgi:hypothetical protein
MLHSSGGGETEVLAWGGGGGVVTVFSIRDAYIQYSMYSTYERISETMSYVHSRMQCLHLFSDLIMVINL